MDQIAAQLTHAGAFDEVHSLLVRRMGEYYQIVSGHHRALAAQQVGLTEVPCWVRQMTDEEAYMHLVLCNAQGELHPLEEGMHALQSGLNDSEYARQVGKPRPTVVKRILSASVAQVVLRKTSLGDLFPFWGHLFDIHPAPEWLWPALVQQLLAEDWTVEDTRKAVKSLNGMKPPPNWADKDAIAVALVERAMRPSDVEQFWIQWEKSLAQLRANQEDSERFCDLLLERLMAKWPAKLSDVTACCQAVEQEQAALMRERQQADLFRQRREEEIAARTARLRRQVSLEEWQTLQPDEQRALLRLAPQSVTPPPFNKQDTTAIEWAQWSWNPVVGCLHNCPYCYARDIAESARFNKAFPFGFAPMLRPESLLTPQGMTVPQQADTDMRYRNVFTCSMADLFGRWVPQAWIDAVFDAMRAAPAWNFLCLTKFPKRLIECEVPENAWMGTTVDLQARVKPAEEAFAHVTTGIRWLSIEPLLEPLQFTALERFQWIVIGGASKSTQTPAWQPPFPWILDIVQQAREAGVAVYFKTNLLGKRILELPFNLPIHDELGAAPAVFHYLKSPGVV